MPEKDVLLFSAAFGGHSKLSERGAPTDSTFVVGTVPALFVLSLAVRRVELESKSDIALRRVMQAEFGDPASLDRPIWVEVAITGVQPASDGLLVTMALDVLGVEDRSLVDAQIEVLWRASSAEDDQLFPGEVYL